MRGATFLQKSCPRTPLPKTPNEADQRIASTGHRDALRTEPSKASCARQFLNATAATRPRQGVVMLFQGDLSLVGAQHAAPEMNAPRSGANSMQRRF